MTELEETPNILEARSLGANTRRIAASTPREPAAGEQLREVDEFPAHAEIEHGDLLSLTLSTNTSGLTHSLHRFPAKYIPQVPRWAVNNFATAGSVVYDPFMGSGTTLVEALCAVDQSYGTDIDPLARLITAAKTGHFDASLNWDVDENGIRRVWKEPGSETPEAYNGFELAKAALSTAAQPPAAPQEELREDTSYESMNLAVMVLSDCGHSSNYTPLLERVAGRIDRHVERLLTAQRADLTRLAQAEPAHPTAGIWVPTELAERVQETMVNDVKQYPPLPASFGHVHSDGNYCQDMEPSHESWPIDIYTAVQMRAYVDADRAMRAAQAAPAAVPVRSQAEPLHITHGPLMRHAAALLRLRKPVLPDFEIAASELDMAVDGHPTPSGEPSPEWLEVARIAGAPTTQAAPQSAAPASQDAEDAARYRWLRGKVAIVGDSFHILNIRPTFVAPDPAVELDAVLDAAMAGETK